MDLPGIQKGVLLKKHTTFCIGGPTQYFFVAKSTSQVITALRLAKKLKLPVFVLGGGSNLLVFDQGIRGLVIKIQNKEPIVLKRPGIVQAPAGAVFGSVVQFAIKKSLKGLEWAGGLPGTFGGAIRGNAGAFGGEIKDSIFSVTALDDKLALKTLSNKQCKFSYRSSIFKEKNWTVLSAQIKLEKGVKKELEARAKSHIAYRKEKHPLEYPNAGSIFKNVDVKKLRPDVLKLFSDKIKKDPFPIVPSAWFVIGAGLAGKSFGHAQVSKKHSNYIVNTKNAKAKDVLALIALIKKEVKKKYGVDLEQEVQVLN